MATLYIDSSSFKLHLGIKNSLNKEFFNTFELSFGLSEELPLSVLSICSDANVSVSEIKKIVYCSGPGSFTGLRSSLSFIKGFSFGANENISSKEETLDCLAISVFLSRGLSSIYNNRLTEKDNSFKFYINANLKELYTCNIHSSDSFNQIEISDITITKIEDKLDSGIFISENYISFNPAYALCLSEKLIEEMLDKNSFMNLSPNFVSTHSFGAHFIQWNSQSEAPKLIYGKEVQAKTLIERGVIC